MDHCQIHSLRQLDAHRLAVEKFHFDLQIGDQIIHRIAEHLSSQMYLLIVFSVHEAISVVVAVQVLHLDFIYIDSFNGIAGAVTVLKHRVRAQVAQLGLNKCPQVAWRAVFHTEHRVQVIIMFDDHAGTKLGGWNGHG